MKKLHVRTIDPATIVYVLLVILAAWQGWIDPKLAMLLLLAKVNLKIYIWWRY